MGAHWEVGSGSGSGTLIRRFKCTIPLRIISVSGKSTVQIYGIIVMDQNDFSSADPDPGLITEDSGSGFQSSTNSADINAV
jgi:hypothetical protein